MKVSAQTRPEFCFFSKPLLSFEITLHERSPSEEIFEQSNEYRKYPAMTGLAHHSFGRAVTKSLYFICVSLVFSLFSLLFAATIPSSLRFLHPQCPLQKIATDTVSISGYITDLYDFPLCSKVTNFIFLFRQCSWRQNATWSWIRFIPFRFRLVLTKYLFICNRRVAYW